MLFDGGRNPHHIFFSKVFKFTWKRAESKEKENFSFFQFLFFELWSFFSNFGDVITTIFYDFFTITRKIKIRRKKFIIYFIPLSKLRITHKNQIINAKLRGEREGVGISLVGKIPNLFLLLLFACFSLQLKSTEEGNLL